MNEQTTLLTLENDAIRLRVATEGNRLELSDKRAAVAWSDPLEGTPWASTWRGRGEGRAEVPLDVAEVRRDEDALRCELAAADGGPEACSVVFRLHGEALHVHLAAEPCAPVELFARGLEAGAADDGRALLPIRMGLLVPAAGDAPLDMDLGTYAYEGVHMAMAGLLKGGAALMATWTDPYTNVRLRRDLDGEPRLRLGFTLHKTARSLALHCLGRGDLATLAAAYRQEAERLGYRVPWSQKLSRRPQASKLFGASNVKLWTALVRKVDEDLREQSAEVHWTFDEAAQIAEHLRHDLGLERVLFHLGGWTRYGYDCRHPDIMPANPECGGNEGLADCARRVQALGYLFCLHDNYQDIYRDAPSWDEYWLQKRADGSPTLGGVWLGGRAYYTCARVAIDLAQRDQNLPAVRRAIGPDAYFIDTTYAVGPQECFDPRHAITRQEDIRWKAALSDYARDVIGLFGSECGREWAVPHADFFEGLTSVSGRYYHQLKPEALGARVVPFFDMVYRDCIALHGKYEHRVEQMAEQVIHHAAIGRPLYYHFHQTRRHLYWQDEDGAELPATGPYDDAAYTRAHNGWAEGMGLTDRHIKNTHEILSPLHELTAQTLIESYDFLDGARLVRRTRFGNGVLAWVNGSAEPYTVRSELGGEVVLPPYGLLVEAPTFVAFRALSFGGRRYDAPVLFTLRSLDGAPLATSRRVRVFHGCGDAQLAWRGGTVEVRREAML